MDTLIKLLVAVTTMGVIGSALAEMAPQVSHPGAPAPAGALAYFESDVSIQYSFADIVNLPDAGTRPRMAGALRGAEALQVAGSKPAQPLGANAAGSLLGAFSRLNDDMDDLSAVVAPDEGAASHSATPWNTDNGFLFSTAEIPEPGDWMTLLCGVVVVAFMARRKSGPLAD
jgi:hypothetical protein